MTKAKNVSSCGYTGTLRGSPKHEDLYPKISQSFIDSIRVGGASRPLKLSSLFRGPHDDF